MSGHADALAQIVTDREKQVIAKFVGSITALQDSLPSAGKVLFSLDKSLSWMSHLAVCGFAAYLLFSPNEPNSE